MSDIRNLWQSQEREKDMITLDDIRARSSKFRGRIRWRNILIGGYSLLTIAVLGFWLVRHPQTRQAMHMLPVVLIGLAVHLWLLFALWWRARSQPLPDDLAGAAALDFHRLELEHQRAAVASAWAWYLLPFLPLVAASFWLLVKHPPPRFPPQMLPVLVVVDLLFFAAIWLAFNWHAARLALELERLKRLHAE